MKTVGEILKTAREQRNVSLEKIAIYTKINLKYLEAIERNEFEKLPAAAFTKGFLHTYASLVGVNPENVLAIFRRDYDQDNRGNIVLRNLVRPVKSPILSITPTMLTIGISIVIGLIIIGFFVRQTVLFSAPPLISITEPAPNSILTSPVTIKGSTDSQAITTINSRPVTVNQDGTFSLELVLTPGEHTIVVQSTGRSGKKTIQERIIYIQ